MSQHYSDPEREDNPHALPDIEVFERTARECALDDEDMVAEYLKRPEFRLAGMNSGTRERMIDAIIAEEGIRGGWFHWSCFPCCLPDGDPIGPFDSYAAALKDAQEG